ncbi:MAG TPA: efflux RND transporter periplasmic adaptor subunit [Azospirillum sp.]|nr:efflux RND transporter periplasmic adaptor subunit [Azospirillum sp.]
MNRSLAIAAAITLAAVVWVLSGQFGGSRPAAPREATPKAVATAEEPVQAVRVSTLTARPMTSEVILQGRTEAWRAVDLRAEVRGRVEEVLVERGAAVDAGTPLVRLAVNDRRAQLDQAKALVAQRQIEYDAARTLNQRGHAAAVQLAQARANLDAALAAARKAEVDLANTEVRAPFEGVLDKRPVNLGDFLDVGNPVAMVVDLDPLRVVGFASERNVAELRVGGTGFARIVGMPEVEGRIAYIAATADAATRTFRVELEIPNTNHRIMSGLTAQLRLPMATKVAHFVAPSALSLADDGNIGVKIVDDGGRARFVPVDIVGTGGDGIWLGGLPERITLITVGHEYVGSGNKVKAVEAPGGPS